MKNPALGGADQVLRHERRNSVAIVPSATAATTRSKTPYRICCEAWRSPDDWLLVRIHRVKVASQRELFGDAP